MKVKTRKVQLFFFFFILLIVSNICFLHFNIVPSVNASGENWWNASWTYRKSHVIGNAAGASTNYQVPITVVNGSSADSGSIVYVDNKTKTDFSDIRFIDIDNSTELNYWIETVNTQVNATFWVQIQDDLSSSAVTIWIYYGNAGASSLSNGENTFLMFDDFDTWNNTLWTNTTANGGTITLSGGALKLFCPTTASSAAKITGTSSWTYASYRALIQTDKGDTTASYRFWGFALEDESKYIIDDMQAGSGWNALTNNGTYHNVGSLGVIGSANSTQLCETDWSLDSAKFYVNNTLIQTGTADIPSTNLPVKLANGVSTSTGGAETIVYVWWVFVRAYVNPEPVQGAWGSEEQESGETSLTFYGEIPFSFGLSSLGGTWAFNRYGSITATFSVQGLKTISFVKESVFSLTFSIDGLMSYTSTSFLTFFGLIPITFQLDSARNILFNRGGVISFHFPFTTSTSLPIMVASNLPLVLAAFAVVMSVVALSYVTVHRRPEDDQD